MSPTPIAPTLADYAPHWIRRVAVLRKPRTAEGYADVLRLHVLPALGAVALADLTRGQVRDFLVAKLAAGYAPGSVATMHRVVRALLSGAVEDGHLRENVAFRMGRVVPKRKRARPAQRALPRADLADVLAVALRRHPGIGVALLVAARSGLRLGELLGLAWEDVDLDRGTLAVRRTLDWRHRTGDPKGNDGDTPPLPLARDAWDALRLQHAQRRPGVPWVFPSPSGRPWSRTWLRAVLIRSCADARVPTITPHALRRTFGTLLAAGGEHPLVIRDLLRHTSVVETEKYVSLDRPRVRAAVGRLGRHEVQ